jgi:hypothetical protein
VKLPPPGSNGTVRVSRPDPCTTAISSGTVPGRSVAPTSTSVRKPEPSGSMRWARRSRGRRVPYTHSRK